MFYRLSRLVCGTLFRVLWRPTVEGREHIPGSGPLIVASNHLSFIDSIIIPLAVPRKVVFLAKAEYWEGRSPLSWPRRLFVVAFDAVPVRREQQRDAQQSLDLAREVLGPRRRLRHLPGGNPVARRAPLPRPDRGGLAGAGGERTDRPRRAGRHRRGAADRRARSRGCAR